MSAPLSVLSSLLLVLSSYPPPRPPHSFPTRRSSDLFLCGYNQIQGSPGGAESWSPYHQRCEWTGSGTAPCRSLFRSGCRSEEHTSELQSRGHLVCRLLLEKKKEVATISTE